MLKEPLLGREEGVGGQTQNGPGPNLSFGPSPRQQTLEEAGVPSSAPMSPSDDLVQVIHQSSLELADLPPLRFVDPNSPAPTRRDGSPRVTPRDELGKLERSNSKSSRGAGVSRTRKWFHDHIPIIKWLPEYDVAKNLKGKTFR